MNYELQTALSDILYFYFIKTHVDKIRSKTVRARLRIRGRYSKKSIKQLNRVSIWVSLGLGLGLVLGLELVLVLILGLVLGFVPSSDLVMESTVLSSLCVPQYETHRPCARQSAEERDLQVCWDI